MVSAEPIKAEINQEALEEYCWSNIPACEAQAARHYFNLQIFFEFKQYCEAKSKGWLTSKGISEGAEYLYRHNDPRDDLDDSKVRLTKEYVDKIIYHALFDVSEAHRDCLDWDRFTNHSLLRN